MKRYMWIVLATMLAVAAAPVAARAQANASPFPDPRVTSASPFPDPNAGASPFPNPNAAASPFPDPRTGAMTSGPAAPPPFASPAPPAGRFTPGPTAGQSACLAEFAPLRDEADKRGRAVQAAGKRHAPPQEACNLFGHLAAAQLKMLRYVRKNSARCGIPPTIEKQVKTAYTQVAGLQKKVCDAAASPRQAGPSFSDVLGSPAVPDATTAARHGGSTFDTLNGNILAR